MTNSTPCRVPQGFRLAGLHCGLKRNPAKQDLTLIVADRPCTAAGVFTRNQVVAAPVALNQGRTPSENIRAVVINSGNANACTGQQGLDDAHEMTRRVAAACNVDASEVLVMSTGIIGELLPMDKIGAGIAAAANQLGNDAESLKAAARGMMTTDTTHKLRGATVPVRHGEIHITGLAKGAAMIGPNMATMLAVILTDARLSAQSAQSMLREIVEDSFNCISVDGHMSTNDTVLLLASGAACNDPLEQDDLASFQACLESVCNELARSIPEDGEGATHLITINVRGCATRDAARAIARTVADSPLVKTAVAGADPNWGRIVSAAGYAGVDFDVAKVHLRVNDFVLFQNGGPVPHDAGAVSDSIRNQRDTYIDLQFGEGEAQARHWSTDLTAEYVRLNADYHT